MKKYNILLIEDDRRLSDGIVLALQNENYNIHQYFSLNEVKNATQSEIQNATQNAAPNETKHTTQNAVPNTIHNTSKNAAKNAIHNTPPNMVCQNVDLIILDINLPDGSGFDYLEKLRQNNNTQVIILTANDLEGDVVKGFELGADDYITKPFSLAVLRARVNARLRIVDERNAKSQSMNIYQNQRFSFDFEKFIFLVNGRAVELSKSEQKLLFLLVSNKGVTLKRDVLLDKVWTESYDFVDENALSVTIKRLRDKLEADASKPEYIKTVYGIGYRFEDK